MLKKKIWANFQRIIELFTQKIVTKLLKIWIWDPGSRGQKRHRIPDPQHCVKVLKKCHLDAGEYPGYGPQGQQEGGNGGQLAGVSVPEVGHYLKTVTMNKTRKRKSISVSNTQK